jgi:Patatin-like phospholipase
MTSMTRWYARTAAALVAVSLIGATAVPFAGAQNAPFPAPPHKRAVHAKKAPAKAAVAAAQQPKQLPARIPFTAAKDAAAGIPGMPDARFWADSIADFKAALPPKPGPWIAFSSGGADGAFGAGLLNGLTESGKRPDYVVVTGVSTGALMAPFVFAGPKYDAALRAYTKITAADVFEIGNTGESFLDSWPLKELIAKQITPELLADIAAAHQAGRRLFIVTTNLDAERSMVWNMGAIAAHAADKSGGDAALKLFRAVMLASSAIPGGFPPVLIDVEADGKQFAEMHVDGGVGGQFFVAPPALMAATSDYKLPATALYVVINTGLQPDFHVVDRSTPSVLTNTVGAAVKVDTRLMIDRAYVAAKRSDVPFNVASIPADFSAPSRGPFDPDYMAALFQVGEEMGRSATPFANEPPAYPGRPSEHPRDSDRTGANK